MKANWGDLLHLISLGIFDLEDRGGHEGGQMPHYLFHMRRVGAYCTLKGTEETRLCFGLHITSIYGEDDVVIVPWQREILGKIYSLCSRWCHVRHQCLIMLLLHHTQWKGNVDWRHHEMDQEKPKRKHYFYLISCKEESRKSWGVSSIAVFHILPRKLQLTCFLSVIP